MRYAYYRGPGAGRKPARSAASRDLLLLPLLRGVDLLGAGVGPGEHRLEDRHDHHDHHDHHDEDQRPDEEREEGADAGGGERIRHRHTMTRRWPRASAGPIPTAWWSPAAGWSSAPGARRSWCSPSPCSPRRPA